MLTRKSQALTLIVLLLFCISSIFFFINPRVPISISIFAFIALLILVISFLNTDFALSILILSMLFSPELNFGGLSSRSIIVRMEDIVLFLVFFGWLARIAIHKEFGVLRTTLLNKPIISYIAICTFSTLFGIFQGRLQPLQSMFFFLKYIEYFLLFFMVANHITDMKKAKFFVYFLLLTCLLVSVYGWLQIPSGERVTAPFEGREGEPNTLGGYFVLMMGIMLGLTMYLSKVKAWLMVLFGITFVPFLFTLSRGSWVAFIPMCLTLIIQNRRYRLPLTALFIAAAIFTPLLMPAKIHQRFNETFNKERAYSVAGSKVYVDESTAARLDSWQDSFVKIGRQPFIGYGIPSATVVDNQYTRVLTETGIVGLVIFLWLMFSIWRTCQEAKFLSRNEHFAQGISVGFSAGFIGLLFHSLSAASFIIIRIMEPFWFLAAIVAVLPRIISDNEKLLA